MGLEERCATLWQERDSGVYHLDIALGSAQADGLSLRFSRNYARRDTTFGNPAFPRVEDIPCGVAFRFTMRDLAQAFMGEMTSGKLADELAGVVDEDASQPHVLPTIRVLDDFFRYGFVLEETREKDRWRFWRVYAPALSAQELRDMIPSRYRSKSRHDPLAGDDGKVAVDGFSPLLKTSGAFDYVRALEGRYAGVPAQDAFVLKRMAQGGIAIAAREELCVRLVRRWHHPFVLLYDADQLNCATLFPDPSGEEQLAHLRGAYPRLASGPVRGGFLPELLSLAGRLLGGPQEYRREGI